MTIFYRTYTTSKSETLRVRVSCINMVDYELLHYEKDKLRDACMI